MYQSKCYKCGEPIINGICPNCGECCSNCGEPIINGICPNCGDNNCGDYDRPERKIKN